MNSAAAMSASAMTGQMNCSQDRFRCRMCFAVGGWGAGRMGIDVGGSGGSPGPAAVDGREGESEIGVIDDDRLAVAVEARTV